MQNSTDKRLKKGVKINTFANEEKMDTAVSHL